jgi:hypothetical protein
VEKWKEVFDKGKSFSFVNLRGEIKAYEKIKNSATLKPTLKISEMSTKSAKLTVNVLEQNSRETLLRNSGGGVECEDAGIDEIAPTFEDHLYKTTTVFHTFSEVQDNNKKSSGNTEDFEAKFKHDEACRKGEKYQIVFTSSEVPETAGANKENEVKIDPVPVDGSEPRDSNNNNNNSNNNSDNKNADSNVHVNSGPLEKRRKSLSKAKTINIFSGSKSSGLANNEVLELSGLGSDEADRIGAASDRPIAHSVEDESKLSEQILRRATQTALKMSSLGSIEKIDKIPIIENKAISYLLKPVRIDEPKKGLYVIREIKDELT